MSETRPPSRARDGLTLVTNGFDMKSRGQEQNAKTVALRLCVFQLGVPVQILAPAFWRIPQSDGNSDCWYRFGPSRHSSQMHAGFGWRSPPFTSIAGDAAGDDILPVLTATLSHGENVIERQFAGGKRFAAV